MSTDVQRLVESAGLDWCEAAEKQALAQALSDAVCKQLNQALSAHDSAMLVVSGGSTPAPVFERLAVSSIDWSRVVVTLADERWVPNDHPDSNESLVRKTLLVNNAQTAKFLSLYHADASPHEAIHIVNKQFIEQAPSAMVVILGMGNDGHTASLFPDADESELAQAMALNNESWVAVLNPPSVTQARITLTRSALLRAQHRFLHITGDKKSEVLCTAMTQSKVYQAGDAPVIGLLTEQPQQCSVYWSP